MIIKQIEYNWYVAESANDRSERYMTFRVGDNCESIEEKNGYVFVTTEDEIHRLPLGVINTTIYQRVKEEDNE